MHYHLLILRNYANQEMKSSMKTNWKEEKQQNLPSLPQIAKAVYGLRI